MGTLLCALAADRSLVLWIVGYGVLVGVSTSLFEVARPVVLRHHFDRHYGLANGIVGVGCAFAYSLFPPVWEAILSFGYVSLTTADKASPTAVSGVASTASASVSAHSGGVIAANSAADASTPGGGEQDAFRHYQASRIVFVMLSVTALYVTHGVLCVLFWSDNRRGSDGERNMTRSSDNVCSCFLFLLQSSIRSSPSPNFTSLEAQQRQRSSARRRIIFKWRLLRNRDFLIITIAHTLSYSADVSH